MKWINYALVTCAIFDIVAYSLDKSDTSFKGLIIIVLLFLTIYAIVSIWIVEKRRLMDRRPFLSVLILMPCFIYLFIHVFLVLWWIINMLRMIFPGS